MKTISLKQLCVHLNCTDVRTARKWCRDNRVLITKQSKNEFVFETNFKEAFEKPFIDLLKTKYGRDWKQVYLLYTEGNVPALSMLHQIPDVKRKAYVPKNKDYLSQLNHYAKTKVT